MTLSRDSTSQAGAPQYRHDRGRHHYTKYHNPCQVHGSPQAHNTRNTAHPKHITHRQNSHQKTHKSTPAGILGKVAELLHLFSMFYIVANFEIMSDQNMFAIFAV